MKKITILFLIIILSVNVHAQLTDVITGLNEPGAIAILGNDMYIGERTKVVKIDLTDPSLTPIDILTGFTGGVDLLLHGNELYVGIYAQSKVVKLDISTDSPTPVDVITGVIGANGLAIQGDYLYIAESAVDKISKVDLSQANPTAIDVITGVDFPNALLIKGNDLYFIQVHDDKISKIDLTEANPTPIDIVTDLQTPSLGLLFIEDELYFSQYGGDKVSKIDINDTTREVTDVITDVDGPAQLLYENNELFIAIVFDNKVSKLSNAALSVEDLTLDSKISLYPNPTSDVIAIQGLRDTHAGALHDITGKKIMDVIIQENMSLDLVNLNTGIYFLVFESGWTEKIVKK